MDRCRFAAIALVGLVFGLAGLCFAAPEGEAGQAADAVQPDAAGLAFFEERVRPVLAEHCYGCHSHGAEKVKGGVYLDSRSGMIEGFAAEPGDPEASLMIEAVRYANPHMQMPPMGKLADRDIEALQRWVAMGMPWPEGEADRGVSGFDLNQRRASHWSWQPPRRVAPPPLDGDGWARGDIDRFIRGGLEPASLKPAPAADRATLIRRLSLDLTGLPPTPAETDAFVNDPSPDAYEKQIDRLLASPRFGEQWARHWLDLVRYGESYGHEFDFDIYRPWAYRDYVIRALNDDVPYDQFLREHLAGDLLETPRTEPSTGENQSVQGTGWYWLGEQTHSPVDPRAHQADFIANQIDVIGRAFQGMTIACARCHDHKFDAISTEDYYALYGVMQSTAWAPTLIKPKDRLRGKVDALVTEGEKIDQTLRSRWRPELEPIAVYMTAAAEVFNQTRGIEDPKLREAKISELTARAAEQHQLDAGLLSRWVATTYDGALRDGQHPLHGWHITAHAGTQDMRNWWAGQPEHWQRHFADAPALREGDEVIYDAAGDQAGVITRGLAFGGRSAAPPGELLVAAGRGAGVGQITVYPAASSATAADRWQGVLQTPARPIEKKWVHVLAQGRGARINFVIDGFRLIRAPIYGPMRQNVDAAYPQWYSVNLDKWMDGNDDFYVEFADSTATHPGNDAGPTDAHGTLYRVIISDHGSPPGVGLSLLSQVEAGDEPTVASVAAGYERLVRAAAAFWLSGAPAQSPQDHAKLALVSCLLDKGLVSVHQSPEQRIDVEALAAAYREIAVTVPVPHPVLAAAEATPQDAPIFIRGSHTAYGPAAPRRYLEAIVGKDATSPDVGSGRIELADELTDPANPLTARVAVNRLWHHLFGRGIVATPDNLGVLGLPPTHPELLDFLAVTFVEDDHWSTKAMIKRIVMSAAYRQSSDISDAAAEQADPQNLLLHRQNLRRMSAESIRDTILHASGRLDATMFGPSVPIHLTDFMDGRGRPQSGPIDGAGRRSIYLSVRRNFLSPMMLAFDAPAPFSTVGRRNTTNVPAQALMLMNDPFVHQQAERWAKALVQQPHAGVPARLTRVWRVAFGVEPDEHERDAALSYLRSRARAYGIADENLLADHRPWQDLCHAMFNSKAFIYLR